MVLECYPVPQRRLSGTDLVSLVAILVYQLGLRLKDQAFIAVYIPVYL